MKALLIASVLFGTLAAAHAQEGGLTDARILHRADIDDPAAAVRAVEDGWFAFSYPAVEGTHTPCCWSGRWTRSMNIGCSLDEEFQSFGTTSDAPLESSIVAYARVTGGAVTRLRVAGARCPMDAGGQAVTWIDGTTTTDTLDWLETLARDGNEDRVGHPALWALALHQDSQATEMLISLARDTGAEQAGEAVFWLGEARGQEGLRALEVLLDELPDGETRRQINVALGMNESEQVRDLLDRTARYDRDPKQRAQALFWLANSYPDSAMEPIMDAIRNERDPEVLDQAVFALSQLPDDVAGPALLTLAKDPALPREARRQALFWLAHEGDEESVAALTEMLTR